MVIDACAPHIFGPDYLMYLEEIFSRTGMRELRQEILAQMPRRFGKTTMVAMIVAVLAAMVPGMKIGIFSTSKRTSKKLMDEIKAFLHMIPGAKERIYSKNSDELTLSEYPKSDGEPDPKTVSKIYCYPASERTTRGFTVDMIILEEAAHIPESIFNYVVVPAIGTENMVLLAITTPKDPTNYFSRLTTLKREDGQSLFLDPIARSSMSRMSGGRYRT